MKFFEDLRENAKIELARMDREGRIGGEPIPNEELSDEEKAELDSIGAAVGGFITGQPTQATMPDPYQQQQMMYRQGAPVAMGNAGYAPGGTVTAADDDIDSTQPTYTDEQLRNAFAPGFSFLDSPVDSAATSSVILYGPGGEVVTLFLPAQQDLYDEYIEKGYSTEQVKVTTETDVGQPQGGGGSGPIQQDQSEKIPLEDMSIDELTATIKGLGTMNSIATAIASTVGLPITALINTATVAQYNDAIDLLEDKSGKTDHGFERKGSIFGGESSLFEGLEDSDGSGGSSFGDTWLGDLLGFDGAYQDCDGACTIDLIMDDDNLAALKASRSMKKGTPDPEGRGTKVKFIRKFNTGRIGIVCAYCYWADGSFLYYDTDGTIGNGSNVEIELSVYDTSRPNIVGTRLDKVKVVDHVAYVADTAGDDASPPPAAQEENKAKCCFNLLQKQLVALFGGYLLRIQNEKNNSKYV